MLKKMVWSEEENTIRGSFINICITTLYMILIVLGSIFSSLASNLREMETLLIGVFVTSFGLWTGKKSIEFIKKASVDSVLQKFGLSTEGLQAVKDNVVKAEEIAAHQVAEKEAAK